MASYSQCGITDQFLICVVLAALYQCWGIYAHVYNGGIYQSLVETRHGCCMKYVASTGLYKEHGCLYIPHFRETLTYACMHTLVLGLLAFFSASTTINRKTPTHMSLPGTWWLLSTGVVLTADWHICRVWARVRLGFWWGNGTGTSPCGRA
jgi:hypothetical protein